jgi:hypothetical protein
MPFSFRLFCWLCACLPLWLVAQPVDSARLAIERDLARAHFDAAEARLPALPPAYAAFYRAHLAVYRFLGSQDPRYLGALRGGWRETEQALVGLPDPDPLKLVMLAELYSKRAALEFMEHNYLSAVRFAKLGRSHAKQAEKAFPGRPEQQKLLGLYNVALGAVPSQYQWITKALGFDGDVEAGLAQLAYATEHSQLLRQEAPILTFFIEKNILDRPERSVARIQQEREAHGPNLLLDYLLAGAYLSDRQAKAALEILVQGEHYRQGEAFFFPFWDYLTGKAHYYQGDQRAAQQHFSRFLKAYPGKLLRADATFRLAMSLTLSGSYPAGRHYFLLLSEDEEKGFDSDAYAQHMAQTFARRTPSQAELDLFLARNSFDGGDFTKALGYLYRLHDRRRALSEAERLEMHYRFGRVYHAQDSLAQAALHYEACRHQPAGEQLWLQAYATYYLGEIAHAQGQPELARSYFEHALSYDGYFYQTGLENRAKVALQEMKKR